MLEEDTKARLGSQLAEQRRRRGWTLNDVARRSTRQQGRLSEIENGKANITIESMADVGNAVGLSLVFVPTERLADVMVYIGQPEKTLSLPTEVGSVYEEVFIPDPSDDDDEPKHAGS
jgi:transcriptional regulator with XRE-family HTH domain